MAQHNDRNNKRTKYLLVVEKTQSEIQIKNIKKLQSQHVSVYTRRYAIRLRLLPYGQPQFPLACECRNDKTDFFFHFSVTFPRTGKTNVLA
jgi:hypothetical protein